MTKEFLIDLEAIPSEAKLLLPLLDTLATIDFLRYEAPKLQSIVRENNLSDLQDIIEHLEEEGLDGYKSSQVRILIQELNVFRDCVDLLMDNADAFHITILLQSSEFLHLLLFAKEYSRVVGHKETDRKVAAMENVKTIRAQLIWYLISSLQNTIPIEFEKAGAVILPDSPELPKALFRSISQQSDEPTLQPPMQGDKFNING